MLTKKCQYALHALLSMAEKPVGEPVAIQEVADEKDIPRKFLEAIFAELKSTGIVGSRQGSSGGYYLKRHPSQVNILEVIRAVDGAVALIPCVSLNYYEACDRCVDESSCSLHGLFSQVRDETLKILAGNTLEDLRQKRTLIKGSTKKAGTNARKVSRK